MSRCRSQLNRLEKLNDEIVVLTLGLYTENVLLNLPKDDRKYKRLEKLKHEQKKLQNLIGPEIERVEE